MLVSLPRRFLERKDTFCQAAAGDITYISCILLPQTLDPIFFTFIIIAGQGSVNKGFIIHLLLAANVFFFYLFPAARS